MFLFKGCRTPPPSIGLYFSSPCFYFFECTDDIKQKCGIACNCIVTSLPDTRLNKGPKTECVCVYTQTCGFTSVATGFQHEVFLGIGYLCTGRSSISLYSLSAFCRASRLWCVRYPFRFPHRDVYVFHSIARRRDQSDCAEILDCHWIE